MTSWRSTVGCRLLIMATVMVGDQCGFPNAAWSQSAPWSTSSQRVRVVLSFAADASIPSQWAEQLPDQMTQHAGSWLPAGWSLTEVTVASTDQTEPWLSDQRDIDLGGLAAKWRVDTDQLIVAHVDANRCDYVIRARGIETNTWSTTAVSSTSVLVPFDVHAALMRTLGDVLMPVVEIEAVDTERGAVVVRARAEQLIREAGGAGPLAAGDFLQPVVVTVDRRGASEPQDARAVPWTLLRLVEPTEDGAWRCHLVSAYTRPLRSQGTSGVRHLAYLVRPRNDGTTLELAYRPPDPAPRTGCDVYVEPWPELGTTSEGPLTHIGQTDWRGRIELSVSNAGGAAAASGATDAGRVLVIKYGDRLVARLPILIGREALVRVELPDDRPLIEVESFIRSIEQDVIDLVARRQLMALRVRRLLADGQRDAAQQLVGQLRRMETQGDFLRRMEAKQRAITMRNDALRAKVDKVFADMRQVLTRLLAPTFVQQLQDEVNRAGS